MMPDDPRQNGLRIRSCDECGAYGLRHHWKCSKATRPAWERSEGLQQGSGLTRTPMSRKPSAKQTKRARNRALLRKGVIEEGLTDCEIRWENVCTGRFDGWHHLQKLSQGGSDSLLNMVRACNPCNGKIEDEPLEARRRGWVRSDS